MASLRTTAVLLLLAFVAVQYSPVVAHSQAVSHNLFATDLLSVISTDKTTQNIIYSPVSVYSTLALTYLGAKGITAGEIRQALRLPQEINNDDFAAQYNGFLKTTFKNTDPYGNGTQLLMANRFYVNNTIKISPQFKRIAENNFGCKTENVDFGQALAAVGNINRWMEQQTKNKIKEIMQPDAVDGETIAVLINAIYFHAEWLHPFFSPGTIKREFYISNNKKIEVDTMYADDVYGYAELPHLNAKALEMPFKNSDNSMLVILPNEIEGLKTLESFLKGVNLNSITAAMRKKSVSVWLPKFRTEFALDLKAPLMKLGCSSMFGNNANLTGLFENVGGRKISDIQHKAVLDVNEAGCEAAATTYAKFMPLSIDSTKKSFIANHPFFFAIRSNTTVFFAGHVAKF